MSRSLRCSAVCTASLAFVLIFAGGCATGRGASDGVVPDSSIAAAGSPMVYSRAVHVLVDGRDRGMVPRTVQVRRSFGTRMVSLWQAGKEIRTYELMSSPTGEGRQLEYSFFGSQDPTSTVYDVSNLPTDGENEYIVPFSPGRITVEDREYGLMLIVEE